MDAARICSTCHNTFDPNSSTGKNGNATATCNKCHEAKRARGAAKKAAAHDTTFETLPAYCDFLRTMELHILDSSDALKCSEQFYYPLGDKDLSLKNIADITGYRWTCAHDLFGLIPLLNRHFLQIFGSQGPQGRSFP